MTRSSTLTRDAPPVDPRILLRRAEVERANGRRWVQRLRWVLVVVAVPALLFAATRSPALDVDRIEVAGAQRSGVVEVAAASGVQFGDPLTDLDRAGAARGIEQLPWVADATVDRVWPDTVRITVTERAPVAALSIDEETWLLVAQGGQVLAPAVSPMGLPVIVVDGEVPAPGGRLDASTTELLGVAAAVPPSLSEQIGTVRVASDGIRLQWRRGGEVLLATEAPLHDTFRALATMHERVDLQCLATLDLRVPSTPVLTREAACE